ncbi:thioesterase domain-containing protein, partial [Nocardia sp. NPDC057272]|uniref:thioesterase domain-containing protein n=1 Tax=Nocardia sp. NPDC057272 TaxID=3346079 RepID=UPI00363B2D6A
STPVEEKLAAIYAQVLGLERVGVDDSFFDLGGNSLLAMQLVAAIHDRFDAEMPVSALFTAPTVADFANILCDGNSQGRLESLEILQRGKGAPLFCVHPAGGVSWPYRALAQELDCSVVGLQDVIGLNGSPPKSLRQMAERHVDQICSTELVGPPSILGWSFGGTLAHAIAIEMRRRGLEIGALIILDALPNLNKPLPHASSLDWALSNVLRMILRPVAQDLMLERKMLTYAMAQEIANSAKPKFPLPPEWLCEHMSAAFDRNTKLLSDHQADVFEGSLTLITAGGSPKKTTLANEWSPYVTGPIVEYDIDSRHEDMLDPQSISKYVPILRRILTERERESA